MYKYSFTFLLMVLVSITSQAQDLELLRSTLDQLKKEFHQQPISSGMMNQSNLRVTQVAGKKLDSLVQEKWNGDTQDWEYSGTAYFYYDQIGRPSQLVFEIINPISTIAGTLRVDILYDEIENNISEFYAFKFPDSEEWLNDGKDEFYYDQNGRLKEYISFYSNEGSSEPIENERSVYTYNDIGKVDKKVNYDWWDGVWYETGTYDYFYNPNGELIKTDFLLKKYESGEFYVSSFTDYIKTNSLLIEENEYFRFGYDDNWGLRLNRKLYYDIKGNLVNDSTFSYSNNQPKLVNVDKYEYDLSVDVSEINLFISFLWDPFQHESIKNQPTVNYWSFFYEEDNFMTYSKTTYYFSESTITNTENSSSETINIYPNPAREILNIDGIADGQVVSIQGIDGSHIANYIIQNGKISTRSLQPGMYILDLGTQKLKFAVSR